MQIHELNNFTGTLGAGSYVAMDDGNDTGKLSHTAFLAPVNARIDNIIAGEAPSAEEIVDARLGADGVPYPSLGDAIRDQFTDVKSEISDEETARIALAGRVTTAEGDIDTLETHKVAQPLDEYNQPTDGTSGQSLRTKGDGTTEWADVGLPTDAQTAQAVSDWLDDHPEATTTVADGSLTEPKFSPALALKSIKDYVTPEMFGAVGDGTTDDYAAINAAISSGKMVLLTKMYASARPISLPESAYILGTNRMNSGIVFAENCGFMISGRYVTIEGINIVGTNATGNAIGSTANGETYNLVVRNVIISDFDNGINLGAITWDCTFENIRINTSNIAVKTAIPGGAMAITFINLHVNHCTKCAELNGSKILFISCNFGIISFPAIEIGNVSRVSFLNCNFECDEMVTTENEIMIVCAGHMTNFEDCWFKVRAVASARVFSVYNATESLYFKQIYFQFTAGNEMPESNIFPAGVSNTAFYGAIVFDTGTASLPRPSWYNSTQLPNWIDRENNSPIWFYGTVIDKTKLHFGQLLWSFSQKCLCVYNNANVVKVSDGTIIV